MFVQVLKKNGKLDEWQPKKIVKALMAASGRETKNPITEDQIQQVVNKVEYRLTIIGKDIIKTEDLHSMVMQELSDVNHEVYLQYKGYREYKKEQARAFRKTNEAAQKIIGYGDKENANKDSTLNSTKQTLIGEQSMQEMFKSFEVPKKYIKAHEEGWIYIHDLSSRMIPQINCCLFDMGKVLENVTLNGVEYEEIKSVLAAFSVMGDVTLSASAQQYGGFTIPQMDEVMSPYANKTYERLFIQYKEDVDADTARKLAYKGTIRQIEQGYQGFETKLNTINSSLGQTPFVTITIGLGTDRWSREIAKVVLKTRMNGLGKQKITAIFPKIVFPHRKEINGNVDSPNYDIKKLAIECSQIRMYPDWLSLDEGFKSDTFERCGKAVLPLGCRAFLSAFNDPITNEEIYTGRSNIGAVTLNLPKIAIESNGSIDRFYELINHYTQLIFDFHEWTYAKVGKAKGSTNPLLFVHGGSWMSVGYDDPIKPILAGVTASLGYVGMEEMCQSLFGSGIYENHSFAIGLTKHLRKLCDEAKEKYNHLYALYSTPAESLVYKVQLMNREKYGIIPNVTDREYCTNSFHIPVWQNISAPEKIFMEKEFQQIATGGHITYNEYEYGTGLDVLESMIDYAMDSGLYYGVNIVSGTCNDCSEHGDFDEECPKCHSHNITSITRCCGYLSYQNLNGDTRYNEGKQKEVAERVKHSMVGV